MPPAIVDRIADQLANNTDEVDVFPLFILRMADVDFDQSHLAQCVGRCELTKALYALWASGDDYAQMERQMIERMPVYVVSEALLADVHYREMLYDHQLLLG